MIRIVFWDSKHSGEFQPRFVEVENESGQSVRLGEWVAKGGGMWELQFTSSDVQKIEEVS